MLWGWSEPGALTSRTGVLPEGLRARFEAHLGTDLGGVRVHGDAAANQAAAALQASAFTLRDDIYFAAGAYRPETAAGRRLLAHEVAHVAQQRRGLSPLIQRQRSPVSVGSPTLEIAAVQSPAFLSTGASPLLPDERAEAEPIFRSSLNLDVIRIAYSGVVSAPTTLGNTIRVRPGYRMPYAVLIHELTHVWQYQTMGTAYISDSLWHQAAASVTSLLSTGRADRSGAYRYRIQPGLSFYRYTAEQQASIVEDYYRLPALRSDAEYQRLIAEVRAARPLNVEQSFWEERAAGLSPRQWAVPASAPAFGQEAAVVPQIEIRVPGL
jgi:hypothetical protein